MAVYAISDIHGEYDMFMDILEQISLNDTDTLYVLGDILDRGPHPIKVLKKLMEMPNAVCLVGNHELMALKSLRFLLQEITTESINNLDAETLNGYLSWYELNGGQKTIDEFRALSIDERNDLLEFMMDFSVYEEISVAGCDYILVHAGLGGFYPGKNMGEYTLKELVWDRADYNVKYFSDKYVVTGHTPTQFIDGNPRPGFIYRHNNHIAIDCGAYFPSGRLAAICLDTGEEFYSKAQPLT